MPIKRLSSFSPRPFRLACPLPTVWCITPRARRLVRITIQYGLLTFVLLILVLWLGNEFQESKVRHAQDTIELYGQPQVCGVIVPDNIVTNLTTTNATALPPLVSQTFPNVTSARQRNDTIVAHCGDCGSCSNVHDIAIYDATKNTLFADSVACAKRALIWGRKTAANCMNERVGFTAPCNDCWVENIMCDLKKCIFICMWHGLFNQLETSSATENDPQQLNRCTLCDELRCGPEFLQCAGANRRRAGILSDIERDAQEEVCQRADDFWWQDERLVPYQNAPDRDFVVANDTAVAAQQQVSSPSGRRGLRFATLRDLSS